MSGSGAAPPPASPDPGAFCSACGTRIPPGGSFCPSCGTPRSGGPPLGGPAPEAGSTGLPGGQVGPPGHPPLGYPAPAAPPVLAGTGPKGGKGKRGLVALALVVVGVVAIGGVGVVARRALLGGGGGASSPGAAVEQLAAAISGEDVVAAAAVLAPDEVRSLGALLGAVEEEAGRTGFAGSGGTYSGLDIEVEDLDLDVEQVADDVARVTIRRGRAGYRLDREKLGDRTRQLVGGEAATGESFDAFDLADDEGLGYDPFVMVVRRGGGWYVSLAYTVAEYLVREMDLPDADHDGGGRLGDAAEDPATAVEELVERVGSWDPVEVASRLPEDEWGVLVAYEDAIVEALESPSDGGGSVSEVDVEVVDSDLDVEDLADGAKKVVIRGAEGEVSWTDDGEDRSEEWDLDGWCLTVTDHGDPGSPSCLVDDETYLGAALGPEDPFVVTVRERGGWVVSPVSTVLQLGREVLPRITPEVVLVLLGRPDLVEPTGQVAVGDEVEVELGPSGVATYEIVPEDDVEVVLSVDDGDSWAEVWIADAEGRTAYGDVGSALTAGEEYRLVVRRDRRDGDEPVVVTIGSPVTADLPDRAFGPGLEGELTPEEPVHRYLFSPPEDTAVVLVVDGEDVDLSASVEGEDTWCGIDDRCELEEGEDYVLVVRGYGSLAGPAPFSLRLADAGGSSIDGAFTSGGYLYEGESSFHDLEVAEGEVVQITVIADDGSSDFDVYVGGTAFTDGGHEEVVIVPGPFSGELEVALYHGDSEEAGYSIILEVA